MKNDMCEIVTK